MRKTLQFLFSTLFFNKGVRELFSMILLSIGTLTYSQVTVTDVNSPSGNGSYKLGDNILIQIIFSANVDINTSGETIQLTLETGTTDAVVSYTGGDKTNVGSIQFVYTVASGEENSDLDYVGTGSFNATPGAIVETGTSTDIITTLPAPGDPGSLSANHDILVDGIVPANPALDPADDATGVSISNNLVLTFSENVNAVSGKFITIFFGADDTQFAKIEATDSQVGISGGTVDINPTNDLAGDNSYYVHIDPGAFQDDVGNDYAGISNNTDWSFTTSSDSDDPLLVSTTPGDNATGISVNADLVLQFNEPVNPRSGRFFQVRYTDGTIAREIADVTDPSSGPDVATITGTGTTVITIDFNDDLSGSTDYHIITENDPFTDLSGNHFAGINSNTTWNFATASEAVDPTAVTFSPLDNSTGVNTSDDLIIEFNEPIQKGSGTIDIYYTADNRLVQSIDVSSVTLTDGNTIATINPPESLEGQNEHYVLIDATAFTDNSGNNYAGISSTTAWSFTTANGGTGDPIVSSLDPTDNEIGVSTSKDLTVIFNEAVTGQPGKNITVHLASDQSIVETIAADAGTVTGHGSSTINIDIGTLNTDTEYYINIESGAFKDNEGKSYAGINDQTTWSFTTVDTQPPTLTITRNPVTLGTFTGTTDNSVSFDLAFNEKIDNTTFDITDITINTGGTVNHDAPLAGDLVNDGDDQNYTFTINSITGDGSISITVGPNIQDLGGNSMSAAEGPSDAFTIDNTLPTLTITRDAVTNGTVDQTDDNSVSFSLAFSELINNSTFTTGDITINKSGTVDHDAPSGGDLTTSDNQNYTFTINNITGDGDLSITVGPSIEDEAGNNMASAEGSPAFTIDNSGPVLTITRNVVTSGSFSGTNDNTVSFDLAFDETIDNTTFDISDITINAGGTVIHDTPLSGDLVNDGDDQNYTFTINNISGDGDITISVGPNIEDIIGISMASAEGPSDAFTIDNTAPTLTINRNAVTLGSFTATTDNSVSFDLVFDGEMDASTFTVGDITINLTGTVAHDAPVSGDLITSDNITFTFTINNITGDGDITITVGPDINDAAGNVMAAAEGPSNAFTIDNTPPDFTSIEFFDNSNDKEEIFINLSEPLGIADGTVPDIGTPGFTVDSDNTASGFDTGGGDKTEYQASGPRVKLRSNNNGSWTINSVVSYNNGGGNITDAAGNEMAGFSQTPSDNTDPTLGSGLIFYPNGTSPETIVFQMSEEIDLLEGADVTGLSVSVGTIASAIYSDKGNANYITITSSADGQWTDAVTVSYSEASGNIQDVSGNPLADFTAEPIRLTNVHIQSNNDNSTNLARSGDEITLTFTTTATLSEIPIVTIDGISATVDGALAPDYTATLTTSGSNNDGVLPFLISVLTASDSTGVDATTDDSQVTFDKTPPTLSPRTIASDNPDPSLAKVDDIVTLGFTVDETLVQDPTVTIDGVAATIDNTNAPNYTATVTMTPTNTEGTLAFSVSVEDLAGNVTTETTATDASSVTLDRTPPTVTSIANDNGILNSWSTTNGTSSSPVSFTVTFNESVTGVDITDFQLVTAGDADGSDSYPGLSTNEINSVTGSGDTYTVTITGPLGGAIEGTGTLRINFIDDNTVLDAASNPTGDPPRGDDTANDGDFITSFTGTEYYTIVIPEPSSHPDAFSNGNITTTTFEVTWTNPSLPTQPATHHLVVLKDPSGTFPTVQDGDENGDLSFLAGEDSDLSDGIMWDTVAIDRNSTIFDGLASGTAYDFEIYPLTLSPNNSADNVDFKTDGTILTTNGFTNTGNIGTITAGAGTEPATLSALVTSDPNPDAVSPQLDASLNFDFTITDDGANDAIDNSPTKISEIIVFQGSNNQIADWTQAIAGAELSASGVGTTIAGTIASDRITFSSIPAQNPGDFGHLEDGTVDRTKTFTLKIWLKETLGGTLQDNIDEKFFEFKVDGNTSFTYDNTDQASSTIGTLETEESGDNTNQVVAAAVNPLLITTDPYPDGTNNIEGLNNPVTLRIEARDQNGNLDLTIDGTPSVTAPEATFSLSNQLFANGIFETTDLQYSDTGDGTLTITFDTLTVTTNPVDVNHSTINKLTDGVETDITLNGGLINSAILGFQVTGNSGPNSTPELNEVIIRFGNPITNVLENIRILRSSDNTIGNGNDTNITGALIITKNSDHIVISGFDASITTDPTDRNYFLVVDINSTVDFNTPEITPSITASGFPDQDVKLSSVGSAAISGSVAASVTGLTYGFNDITPPVVINLTPASGYQSHPKDDQLILEFSEEVIPAPDSIISLYKGDSNVFVADVKITTASSDSTTYFYDVTGLLESDVDYYILIAEGAFEDQSGRLFAGFTTTTDWYFKTADETPPVYDPDRQPDFVNITDVGFDLRVALDEPGTVFYIVVDPDVTTGTPTVEEIRNGTFTGTLHSGSGDIIRGFEYHYFSVFDDDIFPTSSGDFRVWLTAEDDQPTPNEQVSAFQVTPDGTFADPVSGVFIQSTPDQNIDICTGEFQRIFAPINIVEGSDNDFATGNGQTFSFALPSGFEFKLDAAEDNVTGQGTDISNVTFSYINDQTMRITFDIDNTNGRDKIIISGLEIIRTDTAEISDDVVRLGGTAFTDDIPEGTTIVTLNTVNVSPVQFTTDPPQSSIGDNIPKVVLIPETDDGINQFFGDGVVGDTLYTEAAGLGTHEITLRHTTELGCVTNFSKDITIFDNESAVVGLETLYCTDDIDDIIPFDGRAPQFELDTLFVSVPEDIDPEGDSVLVQSLFEQLNGDFEFTPSVFGTPENFAKFTNEGGRLGDLNFTGVYLDILSDQRDTVVQRVSIYIPPTTSLNFEFAGSVQPDQYCEDDGNILLDGSPRPASGVSEGFFQVNDDPNFPGLTDLNDGTATLNTQVIADNFGFNELTIQYIFEVFESGCNDTTTQVIRINPKPVADFNTGTACETLETQFKDISTIEQGSIMEWLWNFDDENAEIADNTDSTQNPIHIFSVPATYDVTMSVTSEYGCQSDVKVQPVVVGGIPDPDFVFAGVSVNEGVTFRSTSTVFATTSIDTVMWEFGNRDTLSMDNSEILVNNYSTPGIYNVTVTPVSGLNCRDSLTKKVFVMGNEAPANNSVYFENFESDDGDWITDPDVGKWEWGTPGPNSGIESKPAITGDNFWITNLSGPYDANAKWYIYSPAFDLSNLDRPMISFNSNFDLANNDGVVMQYSTDSLNIGDPDKEWNTTRGGVIGTNTTGLFWYNASGLLSKPGAQITGDYGWTGVSDSYEDPGTQRWNNSRHSLATIPPEQRGRIVFRFALSGINPTPRDGFAFDNMFIRNRTRVVLLENFTNHSSAAVPVENSFIQDFVPSTEELVKISYHTSFPGDDAFNEVNPRDPAARALYYGASSVPKTFLDGFISQSGKFSSWGETEFSKRTLVLSPVDISLNASVNSDRVLTGSVDITAFETINESVILHVAVVEKEILLEHLSNSEQNMIDNGEEEFHWVLKKLLPNAAGLKYPDGFDASEGPLQLETETFEWKINKFYNTVDTDQDDDQVTFMLDQLAVIAFVQKENSREVLQAKIYDNFTQQNVVTGIEDDLASEGILLYPNPANEFTALIFEKPVKDQYNLRVYDQLGQLAIDRVIEPGVDQVELQTSKLSPGIFIVQIESAHEVLQRKKLMIVH